DRAGAKGCEADARASRERAVRVGHEGSAPFVPRRDEPDRGVRERVDHVEVLFARKTENNLDALAFEALDQETRNVRHLTTTVADSDRSEPLSRSIRELPKAAW